MGKFWIEGREGAEASSRESVSKLCAKQKERDFLGKEPPAAGLSPTAHHQDRGKAGPPSRPRPSEGLKQGPSEHWDVFPRVGKNNMGKVKQPGCLGSACAPLQWGSQRWVLNGNVVLEPFQILSKGTAWKCNGIQQRKSCGEWTIRNLRAKYGVPASRGAQDLKSGSQAAAESLEGSEKHPLEEEPAFTPVRYNESKAILGQSQSNQTREYSFSFPLFLCSSLARYISWH